MTAPFDLGDGAARLPAPALPPAPADSAALDRLVAELYPELKRIAHSRLRRGGQLTLLDTTSLVNETWMRLAQRHGVALAERGHFLAYAARAMRSIVVDFARQRLADKRGGGAVHDDVDALVDLAALRPSDDVLAVDGALGVLERLDPALARLVELRFFAGLGEQEVADVLQVSKRTVQRQWHKARALLLEAMG